MSSDVDQVPGMAEAIEARRIVVGLTPGRFAAAAGLTSQGLMPVRRGLRRRYQDKVKLGVARALAWPPDALDRLMAGEDPATFDEEPTPPGGVRDGADIEPLVYTKPPIDTAAARAAVLGFAATSPAAALRLDPDVVGLAALAGELTPEGRAKVEGYIRALLDQTPTNEKDDG